MTGEPICFECFAVDGLVVRLTKERYYGHILAPEGHPELEWHFRYPASQIQMALEQAVNATVGNRPQTRLYLGPSVIPDGRAFEGKPGLPNARQFRVAVQVENNEKSGKGYVLTAYAPIVRVRGTIR
jgi:hypothetical protein